MLHRAHGAVDEHQLDLGLLEERLQLLDLAGAEEVAGVRIAHRHDGAAPDLQVGERDCQRDSFLERHLRVAAITIRANVGMQDPGAGHMRCMFFQSLPSPSYRLIGCDGMIVEIACL